MKTVSTFTVDRVYNFGLMENGKCSLTETPSYRFISYWNYLSTDSMELSIISEKNPRVFNSNQLSKDHERSDWRLVSKSSVY